MTTSNGTTSALDEGKRFRPDIYWYPSFRCNLACEHCWIESSPYVDGSHDLNAEEALRVVDQMAELGVRAALMSGGEILIWPGAFQVFEALADRGIYVSIESNGLRIDDRFVRLARRLQEAKRFMVSFSLDGGTAEAHEALRGKGTFHRTLRGLERLRDGGVRFGVQAVLNASNFTTIPQLFEIVDRLSPYCRQLHFAFLNPVGRGRSLDRRIGLRRRHYGLIFHLIRSNLSKVEAEVVIKTPPANVPPRFLGMVFNNGQVRSTVSCQFPLLGVLPNGDITICALSRDKEDLRFGNVRTHTLKEVWERSRMAQLRRRYLSTRALEGVCGDCLWKTHCRGSCRAWAHDVGGSFDAAHPICNALDQAGEFPDQYRLSKQPPSVARRLLAMVGGESCPCPM